jgi:hypothetical protein
MKQSTSNVFMIRPQSFRKNEETATNNLYQQSLEGVGADELIRRAQEEFDSLSEALGQAGVNVYVFEEQAPYETPDALFPNNWISTHDNGNLGLYPMYAANRRTERREDIIVQLEHEGDFSIQNIIDFTEFEAHDRFLEGTGSMVLDRVHRKAYAAISPRTDETALLHFCEEFDYEPVAFSALQTAQGNRLPIYHTNVMMSIGSGFCAICLDSIDDPEEREAIENELKADGLEVIALTEEQIEQFAGNMLELQGSNGPIIAMSSSAHNALDVAQIDALKQFGTIVHADLTTIETCGGGSARCMIAEIHLPEALAQ